MRTFRVAWKTILEWWREPQIFWVFLLFPAMLVGIYYIGYGQTDQGMSQFLTLLVCNRDTGPRGAELTERFRAAQFDGQPVYQVLEVTDCRAGERILSDNRAAAMLSVPADFSKRVDLGESTELEWLGDPESDTYVFAISFAGGVLDEFQGQSGDAVIQGGDAVVYEFVEGTGNLNDFQIGIPGVMVFGMLFGSITAALILVRERVGGTLQRLRMARLSAKEIIGGLTLANILLGIVQAGLAFGLAVMCGFESSGSLWLAGAIVALVGLTATGLGALAASFSKNDGEASNIATGLLAPFAFLSGAVFPMPVVGLFVVGGRVITPYDIFPTAHATNALKRVLIYGEGVQAILFELVLLTLLSGVILAIGAWQFRRVME